MSVLKKIIYNCRQATLLLDKKEFTELTFHETIELRIHLYGCSFCRLYGQQGRVINAMVKQLFKNTEYKLDDQFKNELQQRVDSELNKN